MALSHAHHSLHTVKDGHEKDLCRSYKPLFLIMMIRDKPVRLKGEGFNLTNGKSINIIWSVFRLAPTSAADKNGAFGSRLDDLIRGF